MGKLNGTELFLIVIGMVLMLYVLLKAIAQGSLMVAADEIAQRRATEAQRRAEDAAAEAAGRAAALEPLEVHPDGSIVEPILAMVEERSA
jgi:small-conductance mechanosensitive channel